MLLEISDVRTFPVREPVSKRSYTVVQVRTRDGVTGWGECAGGDLARVRTMVLGKSATAYEVIRRDLAAHPAAQAAINMALLDIVGKSAKAPVYQVLGGPTRNKVRALAPAASQDAIGRAHAAGFRAFLVPVSMKPQRTSPDLDFVIDGAASLTPGQASSLAASLERSHPLWIDEPCRLVNLGAVRKISAESVTPIGFGRSLDRPADFQDLLREEVADVLRPDLARHGITQIRRIAAMAETYYMAVAPYHDGGPVASAASLQLAASLPNFFIQQIPLPDAEEDRRMRAEIGGASIETVRDGFANLPGGPGLGIEVNEAALRRYQA